MSFKAAIFDLDGTILNTISDLAAAMNKMLREQGLPETSLEHNINSVGSGIKNYVQNCMPQDKREDAELVKKCEAAMRKNYTEAWNVHTKPYDGIIPLMEYLTEQGIILNVLSNKVDEATKTMVRYWFGGFKFSCVYGERDGKPRKPDPTVALEIAGEIGVSPSEILFIGDSRFDMLTATAAGMYPMAALWGYQSEETLKQHGAAHLAADPYEIIDFIKDNS